MRRNSTYSHIVLIILISVTINLSSCKKNDSPTATSPYVLTGEATCVGQNWAVFNALVKPYNNTVSITFDFDTITPYEQGLNGVPHDLSGNVSTPITAIVTGLKPGHKYHYRVKAVSSTETINGLDTTFTTTNPGKTALTFNPGLTYGTVSDIDNNVYKTITIGTQTWMAENLKTTKFNDGTDVFFALVDKDWADSAFKAYCWYNNDSIVYGAIYNWAAVNSDKLCPTGWHVPSDAEWTTLTTFIGGETTAAGKLMEAGNVHWQTPNSSLTNETGFTALPGGYRNYNAVFSNIKRYGYWWSSTESSTPNAYCRFIYFSFANMTRTNTNKMSGLSVRCVMD
jgi:uncharacterized protein (TIGR02145 family)